jgi:hypothetical protein
VTGVIDALGWDANSYTILVFSTRRLVTLPVPVPATGEATVVRTCELEPPPGGRIRVFEYDIQLDTPPTGLDVYLRDLLRAAVQEPGAVAWLGFEASFSYDFLLAAEVADHIYGVCVHGDEPQTVLTGVELQSPAWAEIVKHAQAQLS